MASGLNQEIGGISSGRPFQSLPHNPMYDNLLWPGQNFNHLKKKFKCMMQLKFFA